ncbi:MAG: hypothetical protein NTV34_21035 [Proteobacteria bacterium]|nr:hypothetical protein [Pseudomonadota bacterium]
MPALDGTLVFPVVGVIARADCSMNPSEKEVQQVHCVTWTLICSPNQKKFSFNMFGCWRDSFLYDCQEFTIWGLSAEILATANF